MCNERSQNSPSGRRAVALLPLGLLLAASVAALSIASGSRIRGLLLNTVMLSTAVCAVTVPACAVVAFLAVRTDLPFRRVLFVTALSLLFVPLFFFVAGWDAGFGQQGWLTNQRAKLGAPPLLSGWPAAIWIHSLASLPWSVVILATAFRFIPAEQEESALLDGHSWQVFRYVTMRHGLAGMLVATIWTFAMTAGEITVTDVFQIRTFAEELFVGYAMPTDPGGGFRSIVQVPFWASVALAAALVSTVVYACSKYVPLTQQSSRRTPMVFPVWHSLPGAYAIWGVVLAAVLFVLIGVPIANLVAKAGLVVRQVDGERIREWSAIKSMLTIAASPWRFRGEFFWSLTLGNLVAFAAMVVSLPLAWIARRKPRVATGALILLATAFAIPGPMLGLAIMSGRGAIDSEFVRFLYDRTLFAPWLTLLIRTLPIASLIMWIGIRSIPEETVDLATLDGASALTKLSRVVIPQFGVTPFAVYLIVLAIAMGELSASALTVPPGVSLISLRIFNLVHYGVEDQLAGICLSSVILFVSFAMLGIWVFQMGLARQRSRDDILR